MKIAIIGTGHIGKTLVRKLSAAGHDVAVANSRGPETIEADLLGTVHARPRHRTPSAGPRSSSSPSR
ncbi:NAD(P)-binding domain-containing protein [Arsenicicoccus sp. UBA7492]|uniref:NAD(P)-binding domain-containing protein n=1 Tax=Arsenicicoccus sp. UBA7492 TaxID=1946057 RepID=UPI00257BFE38|nr:NAD(P)-binding domain-containing protein [Arsenicicoccus sp. UBA7492]